MAILRWAAIAATVILLWVVLAAGAPVLAVPQPASEEAGLFPEEAGQCPSWCDDPSEVCDGEGSCGAQDDSCWPWCRPQQRGSLDGSVLRCPGIELGGWIEQGVTLNPGDPASRSNFPAGYNDRSNDYQLNQLWVYLDRPADNGGYGWALGGRVDLMWGTDGRYFTSAGLEDDWNDTSGDYRLAMPQMSLEVAVNKLSIKLGHFWSGFGYERPTAPDNFFYSHAMSFVTAQPRTFTGLSASYPIADCWSIRGGFHRGWNQWEDENHELAFLGGVSWTSASSRSTASFVISLGKEGRQTLSDLSAWELIVTHRLTDRLLYVIEYQNTEEEVQLNSFPMPVLSAHLAQYGVNQYLIYRINDRWSAGMRFEWFSAFGVLEFLDTRRSCNANHYALTWGLNWQPAADLLVRPELRWNWSDGWHYEDDTAHDQLLLALGVLYKF